MSVVSQWNWKDRKWPPLLHLRRADPSCHLSSGISASMSISRLVLSPQSGLTHLSFLSGWPLQWSVYKCGIFPDSLCIFFSLGFWVQRFVLNRTQGPEIRAHVTLPYPCFLLQSLHSHHISSRSLSLFFFFNEGIFFCLGTRIWILILLFFLIFEIRSSV